MLKTNRFVTLSIVLLFSSLFFVVSTKPVNAAFFNPFENVVITVLETLETLILELSDDIGEMSDDIGVMAGRILIMSDNIGLMADRIILSEERILAAISDSGISSLITRPTDGTIVSASIPIDITLSSGKTDYLLFISNNADMSGATNALVQNSDTSLAWSRVSDFVTEDKLFIAVRTVSETSSSDFSNTVMLNLQ